MTKRANLSPRPATQPATRPAPSPSSGRQWPAPEKPEVTANGEFELPSVTPHAQTLRSGFHLSSARKIEEARERRQLQKSMEDFADFDL